MINATEKSVEDLGEEVTDEEKAEITTAVSELQEVLKGEDKDEIEAKTTALTELSGKLAERAYAKNGGSPEDMEEMMKNAAAQAGAEGNAAADDDGVVDAEFEEVKEDDKK